MRHCCITLTALALCVAFCGCAATTSNPQLASPAPQSEAVRPSDAWMRAMLWENLFSGCKGCGAWSEPTSAGADVALDLPAGEPRDTLMEIRSGPGKLLLDCAQPPVAAGDGNAVKDAAAVLNADSTPARVTTLFTLVGGDCLYLGLISNGTEKKQTLTVNLAREAFVYDILTGVFLGQAETIKAEVGPFAVRLFALLPYKVLGINCRSANACHRGVVFNVGMAIAARAKLSTHVVHMAVLDPNGKPVERYGGNLLLKEGRGIASIPFALNDLVGKWKIQLRDIASGLDCDVVVELLPDTPPPEEPSQAPASQ